MIYNTIRRRITKNNYATDCTTQYDKFIIKVGFDPLYRSLVSALIYRRLHHLSRIVIYRSNETLSYDFISSRYNDRHGIIDNGIRASYTGYLIFLSV